MRPIAAFVALLTTSTAGVACEPSAPAPTNPWAAAQANLGRAQAGGAPGVPDANLHLQFAIEDMQKCKQLMGHDNERAASLCALASSEAELALSLAKQVVAQGEALQAQSELKNAGSQ